MFNSLHNKKTKSTFISVIEKQKQNGAHLLRMTHWVLSERAVSEWSPYCSSISRTWATERCQKCIFFYDNRIVNRDVGQVERSIASSSVELTICWTVSIVFSWFLQRDRSSLSSLTLIICEIIDTGFFNLFFFISFDSFGHGAYLAVEEVETLLQVGDDDLAVAHLLFGLLLLLAVTVRLLLQLHPLLPDSPQKVIDFPPTKKEYEPPS